MPKFNLSKDAVKKVTDGIENVYDKILKKVKGKPEPEPPPPPKTPPKGPGKTQTKDTKERGDDSFVIKFSDAMECVQRTLNATQQKENVQVVTDPDTGKVDLTESLKSTFFGVDTAKQIEQIEKCMKSKLLGQTNSRKHKYGAYRTRKS